MIPELSFACRTALWIAKRIVPAARREDWSREWQSELWHWMADRAAFVGDSSTRSALLRHAGGAIQDALYLRLDNAAFRERWETSRASPAFCLTGCLLLIALLAWTSRGFETSRRLLAGLPFRDPARLVLLSQTGPFMGQRLGFAAQDLQVFRERSRTVEGPASYIFYPAIFTSSAGARRIPGGNDQPGFLDRPGCVPGCRPRVCDSIHGRRNPIFSRQLHVLATGVEWRRECDRQSLSCCRQTSQTRRNIARRFFLSLRHAFDLDDRGVQRAMARVSFGAPWKRRPVTIGSDAARGGARTRGAFP